MANAQEGSRCLFRWKIRNPFICRTDLEATFYHGGVGEYPWKVTFEPRHRCICFWDSRITLALLETPPYEVVARDLVITARFGYDPDTSTEFEAGDVLFSAGTQYRHRCMLQYFNENIMDQYELTIEVEFESLSQGLFDDNYFYRHRLLVKLSQDMETLRGELGDTLVDTSDGTSDEEELWSEQNRDMVLWSDSKEHGFRVHSYIMDIRWNNLRRVHGPGNEMEIDITGELLWSIITYMYSGDFPTDQTFRHSPLYFAELCHVINRYKLRHLYKVFQRNDLEQYQETRRSIVLKRFSFPLSIVENRAIGNRLCTWVIDPNSTDRDDAASTDREDAASTDRDDAASTDRDDAASTDRDDAASTDRERLTFGIRAGNESGNWLSYFVRSEHSFELYVEVNLEMVRKDGGSPETTFPVAGRTHHIPPRATVQSGPVLFLGCPETFGNPSGRDTVYFIRCALFFSTGRAAQWLQNSPEVEYRGAEERYLVLSDHMRELWNDRRRANLELSSFEDPGEVTLIHKEFFKARMHGLWRGIVSATDGYIPNPAVCRLQKSSIPFVVEYIYSGKVLDIPTPCVEDIKAFASRTATNHLKHFVDRYISEGMR